MARRHLRSSAGNFARQLMPRPAIGQNARKSVTLEKAAKEQEAKQQEAKQQEGTEGQLGQLRDAIDVCAALLVL